MVGILEITTNNIKTSIITKIGHPSQDSRFFFVTRFRENVSNHNTSQGIVKNNLYKYGENEETRKGDWF